MRGGLAGGMLMELDLRSQSQRYWGFDEREILGPIRELATGCRTLVDVGANDGYYTMAFLKTPVERVVACEPGPVVDRLLSNAAANGYHLNDRFTIVSKPIGLGAGCLTITELLEDLPRPIMLKVDIEGAEYDLLRSAEDCRFISETRWLIETHAAELETRCSEWLSAHGQRTRIIDNARWRVLLPERRPLAHNRWLTATPVESEQD
jgi:hypothetical protein